MCPQPERLRAIGSTKGLAVNLRRAFEPGGDFEPIGAPEHGDWLAAHQERGQRFDEFAKTRRNHPDEVRNKIYLQPIGAFAQDQINLFDILEKYTAAYFSTRVEVLPSIELDYSNITTRINPFTGSQQILATDVLTILTSQLPADAFCVLAVTMEDLYPDPSWNFVFGWALYHERVAAYSFARFDPHFYGQSRGPDYEQILLKRSCKLVVHETAHMFGLRHCVYFKCILNGFNHLAECDARPMHLCPVCLRKLQYGIDFDPAGRYRNLVEFYQEIGFDDEARWTVSRLKHIRGT